MPHFREFLFVLITFQLCTSIREIDFNVYPTYTGQTTKSNQYYSYRPAIDQDSSLASSIGYASLGKLTLIGSSIYIGYHFIKQANEYLRTKFNYDVPNIIRRSSSSNVDLNVDEALIETKKEQEEIWNAILKIHNEQSRLSELVESSSGIIKKELADSVQKLEDLLDDRLYAFTKQLEVANRAIDEQETEQKERIKALNNRIIEESKLIHGAVFDLKEVTVPKLMRQHDEAIGEKLRKFKEDLRGILSKKTVDSNHDR